MHTVKALVRLHASLSEPLLVAHAISTKILCTGSFTLCMLGNFYAFVVSSDLSLNCLQRLSADEMTKSPLARKELK